MLITLQKKCFQAKVIFTHCIIEYCKGKLWYAWCFSRMTMTLGFQNVIDENHHACIVFIPANTTWVIINCLVPCLVFFFSQYNTGIKCIHCWVIVCMQGKEALVGEDGEKPAMSSPSCTESRQVGALNASSTLWYPEPITTHPTELWLSHSLTGCQFLMWRALQNWRADGLNI